MQLDGQSNTYRQHMAFQIIRHAFRMIFGNFGQALRVSVGPYLLLLAALLGIGLLAGVQNFAFSTDGELLQGPDGFSPLVFLGVIFIILFGLFVFGWVAVSWHRFILLEEYTGALPAVTDRPIWPYVGRSFLYGFLLVLVAMPMFLILSLIAAPLGGFALIIATLIVAIALTYGWFRIAIALPSIAVGKPITLGQAWTASAGISSTILGVAFLLMAFNSVAGIGVTMVTNISVILGVICEIALQWTTLMLGVSILTTFYGHLIEKRPLVD